MGFIPFRAERKGRMRLTKYGSMVTVAMVAVAIATMFFAAPGHGGPTPEPSDEARLEHNFDVAIQPNDLRDWMKVLASQPNQVGSPHDKANADRILGWFKDFGWDAHIETFDVLYPTPISETLE